MRRFFLFFFFLIVSPASFLHADQPSISVKASVNKAFMTVGDKIDFKIEIRHDPRVDILTLNPVTKLRDFEIKEKRDIPPVKEGGYVVEGKLYILTTYTLGEYVIDPVTIRYKDVDGKEKEIKTNKLYITVESIDKNKAPKRDIRDIKSVIGLPSQLVKIILICTGVVLLLIISALVWLFFTRPDIFRNFFAPPLKPHQEAIQAIQRLQDSGLLAKGNVREFYFRLSEIIKKYFQKRFGFKALEDTSSEILEEFLKMETAMDEFKLIQNFFEAVDFVKFAKFVPEPAEIQKDVKLAIEVVERTKPAEEPEKTNVKEKVNS